MIEKAERKPPVTATDSGPRPGDFPIGSPESRAAARALISARGPKLTRYDRDCMEVVSITRLLHAGAWPSYSEMEKLSVWQRGWELVRSTVGFPKFLEAMRQIGAGKLCKCPFASCEFASAHGREASAGDILRWTDLKPSIKIEQVNKWRTIWERRVPEYPFPFKYQTGFLFVRVAEYVLREPDTRTIAGFAPVWHDVPQFRWSWIEDEALGSRDRWCAVQDAWRRGTETNDLMPTIEAVRFGEDGTVKPLETAGKKVTTSGEIGLGK